MPQKESLKSSEKTFSGEFDKFLAKLKAKEPFAFSRFSDGEMFMLQNKRIILAANFYVTGETAGNGVYTEEEQKIFDPNAHQFYRERLVDSFKFRKPGYHKGLSCRGDVGEENFQWQLDLHGEGDENHLTFSNVFINNNYKRYIEEVVPLFADREVILVANKLANLEGLPFEVKKDFRVGSNCIVNNYDIIEEIKDYILGNKLENHIVLCSAASLSNFIIHQLYMEDDKNTYLDIGSTLNPYMNLEGWKHSRGYLTHYWLNSGSPYGTKIDTWD